MKRRTVAIALALLTLVIIILTGLKQKQSPIDGVYVFGDSLSDVGNAFTTTGGVYPPSPPYFQGRYSNGQIWVEYLTSNLKLPPQQTTNFAYGGATTGNDSTIGVHGLLAQIRRFSANHPKLHPTTLCIVWIGANDYLQGETNVRRVIGNVSNAIESLTQMGAKKILVLNLPDLGQLPATRNSAQSNTLSTLAKEHNLALNKFLESLHQTTEPDRQIIPLDIYSIYQDVMKHPTKFGFSNVTNSCLDNQKVCTNPNQFLFWDTLHPTAAAHRILGETAFAVLKHATGRI